MFFRRKEPRSAYTSVNHATEATVAKNVVFWYNTEEKAFKVRRDDNSLNCYYDVEVTLCSVLNSLIESGVLEFSHTPGTFTPSKLCCKFNLKGKK